MILFFRFKNFRTFRQETLINMQAAGYKELPDHTAVCDLTFGAGKASRSENTSRPESAGRTASGKRLLKTMAIYGPNASGKSHLISALQFYCSFVCRQLPAPDPDTVRQLSMLSAYPFAEMPSPDDFKVPLSMCMQFFFRGYLFEYSFTLSGSQVIDETFLINRKVIFQKELEEVRPGRSLVPLLKKSTVLKSKGPCLGTLLNYQIAEFSEANAAFMAFFQQAFLSFEYGCLCRINQFPSLGAVQTKQIMEQPDAGDFIYRHLLALHMPFTGSKQELADMLDPLTCSTGLTKIILLLYRYYHLKRTGGLLIADDFTAFLHPNVSRYLLNLFQAPDNRELQLIFTTHDTALLNRSQFRRDEVAIVSMDHTGSSCLHTLADIRVRADASFSKDYLSGKYGIVPAWEDPNMPG